MIQSEHLQRSIVLLGSNGMLAYQLKRKIDFTETYTHSQLDISSKEDIKKLEHLKPSIIINAAAFTDVEESERNKELCLRTNYTGVKNLVDLCNKINCKLIQYSTDYVFSGENPSGYDENSHKNPINTYGLSKSMAEDYIINHLKHYLIIRTSWLFGEHGKNFISTLINLLKADKPLYIVNDQHGSPTYTKDLADKTKKLINKEGIYHITNSGWTTWYELSRYIIEHFYPNKLKYLNPISTSEYQKKFKVIAERPLYSILINTKTAPLRHWKEAVNEFIETHYN